MRFSVHHTFLHRKCAQRELKQLSHLEVVCKYGVEMECRPRALKVSYVLVSLMSGSVADLNLDLVHLCYTSPC